MLLNGQLPRSSPGEQGVSSAGIVAFLEALETDSKGKKDHEIHSFMLVRHGAVVAEGWWSPYGPQRPHTMWSLSKSFTSTAIGFLVTERRLSVEDYVVSFFPQDVPEKVEENLASMRVRHLLTMAMGNTGDASEWVFDRKEGNWVKTILHTSFKLEPGTHFQYSNEATYMLSAIIQKITGQKLLDYLKPRLFTPLGIEGVTWETCPDGINKGAIGLNIKTEDIAKFGQLYLDKGVWNGKRILSEAWIEEATKRQIATKDKEKDDWDQGYCYQFWRCRHGAYRGDGLFGQFCIVMPEQDAVIAITGAVVDMKAVINRVWEYLLPAMKNTPLPIESEVQKSLEIKLMNLKLSPPLIMSYSPIAAQISCKQYHMEQNNNNFKKVSFTFHEEDCTFTVIDKTGEHQIHCGIGKWLEGETLLFGSVQRILTTGVWSDEKTFTISIRLIETPYCETITGCFEDERLYLKFSVNVPYDQRDRQPIEGRSI